MRKVELTIEFTGITRKFAADCLARYFGTEVKVGLGSGYLVKDKLGRDWTVTYAKSVRADGYLKEDEADDYKNCINTPELYISADIDDSNLIHDLLVILRSCGAMLNELCSMHVLVGCPSDQRKAGVYLSEYCKCQDKQIEMFKTSAAYTARYAKPYQYQTSAFRHICQLVALYGIFYRVSFGPHNAPISVSFSCVFRKVKKPAYSPAFCYLPISKSSLNQRRASTYAL